MTKSLALQSLKSTTFPKFLGCKFQHYLFDVQATLVWDISDFYRPFGALLIYIYYSTPFKKLRKVKTH